jgi:hypothetical protein
MAFVRKDHASAARGDDCRDLCWRVRGVERNGDAVDREGAEVRGAPPRVIVGDERDAVAAADARGREPRAGPDRALLQLTIRERVDTVAALNFDRYAIAEPRRGLVEELDK